MPSHFGWTTGVPGVFGMPRSPSPAAVSSLGFVLHVFLVPDVVVLMEKAYCSHCPLEHSRHPDCL